MLACFSVNNVMRFSQLARANVFFPPKWNQSWCWFPKKTFTWALHKMMGCSVLSTCSTAGNQEEMFLICGCCFEPFTADKPLKRTAQCKVFATTIGWLLCFVLKQQFDLNSQLLQSLNRRRWACSSSHLASERLVRLWNLTSLTWVGKTQDCDRLGY